MPSVSEVHEQDENNAVTLPIPWYLMFSLRTSYSIYPLHITRGNRAFKWELFAGGSLAASHQGHWDFSPVWPPHLHPSALRLFFQHAS